MQLLVKGIYPKVSRALGNGQHFYSGLSFTFPSFSLSRGIKGALAFSKVLKFQKEWHSLADSVSARKSEMDQKEILGIKLFLKQLANEYYDMEVASVVQAIFQFSSDKSFII